MEEDLEKGDGDILSILSSLDHPKNSWILDLTCSYHLTPNKDWLDNYKLVNFGFILMGNNDQCKVVGIENIKIKMFDVVKTLCDVRCISDLKKNLILLGILDHNRLSFKSQCGVLKVSKCAMTVMKG